MADYIYNPAESIKQSFQQAGAGIGNIFSQVIAQQQRDYNLAESAFQNIEALKKDVNIFGQKTITSKSNELLKQAGSAILKNGKLDYSKLGEIRQSISDIKDLKTGYDVGAKEYERMLQLGVVNKDNLVSFEKFYKELSSKMSDENLVKNPQDLQKAMADTYSNNLDDNKMFIKSFSSANPYEKVVRDIKDPKTGALMRVEGQVPKGWAIGADGKVIPKAPVSMVINGQTVTMDYADQELARLQASDPDLLATMRKKAGFAGSNMSDKDIVKFYIDNKVVAPVSATQVKNANQIEAERLQVQKLAFDVANAPAELAMKKALTQANISHINASTGLINDQRDAMGAMGTGGIYYDEKGNPSLNFGQHTPKIDLPAENGAIQKVAASELYYKNGKAYLGYYVPKAGESVDDLIKNGMATGIRKEQELPTNFAKSPTFYNLQRGLLGKAKAGTLNLLNQFPSAVEKIGTAPIDNFQNQNNTEPVIRKNAAGEEIHSMSAYKEAFPNYTPAQIVDLLTKYQKQNKVKIRIYK